MEKRRVTSSRLTLARNVLILLGLWTAAGIVSGVVAFGTNFLPGFIASSNRPGSLFALHVLGSLPFLPFATAAGFAVSPLVQSSRPERWALALSCLFVLQHLGSHSFGWRWVSMELETQIGVPVSALLIGGASLAGFLFARRRSKLEAAARPA